jgi:hypothetical protein
MASLHDNRRVSFAEFNLAAIAADICGLNGEINRLVADPVWLIGRGNCASPGCDHVALQDNVYCPLCQDSWNARLDAWVDEGGRAA